MSAPKGLGLVTNSSTDIEIISAGEIFSKCAWFRHFRLVQGDSAKEDVLTQDRKSIIVIHKTILSL